MANHFFFVELNIFFIAYLDKSTRPIDLGQKPQMLIVGEAESSEKIHKLLNGCFQKKIAVTFPDENQRSAFLEVKLAIYPLILDNCRI